MLAAVCAAALVGWALALLVGLWADSRGQRLIDWAPFALGPLNIDGASTAASTVAGAARLVGVAGRQAFFSIAGAAGSAQRSITVNEGDALPSGERLLRVERDAVVLSTAGSETRVELRPQKALASQAKVGAAVQCRLAASDRAAAIFLDPAVVKALSAERATFARMFEPAGAAGGIRARGTGGTTAMFAIQDGDVLLRADGAPLRAGEAIVTEILSRLESGGSVLVDGTRAGAPKRWVYAAKSCAT